MLHGVYTPTPVVKEPLVQMQIQRYSHTNIHIDIFVRTSSYSFPPENLRQESFGRPQGIIEDSGRNYRTGDCIWNRVVKRQSLLTAQPCLWKYK